MKDLSMSSVSCPGLSSLPAVMCRQSALCWTTAAAAAATKHLLELNNVSDIMRGCSLTVGTSVMLTEFRVTISHFRLQLRP